MVDGDNGRLLEQVGLNTEGLCVVQGRGGIETTGGSVPHVDTGSGCHLLSDRETLALSSGDTTDEGVTDNCLDLLSETVHLREDIKELRDELLAMVLKTLAWGLCLECHLERLTHCQGRIMEVVYKRKAIETKVSHQDVYREIVIPPLPDHPETTLQMVNWFVHTFLIIQDLTAVVLDNVLRAEWSKRNLACDLLVVLSVVSQDSKQGRATSSRTTQDQDHLAITTESVHVVDDRLCNRLWLLGSAGEDQLAPEDGVDQVGKTNEGIRERGDVLSTNTFAQDLEVLPDDTQVATLDAGLLSTGHHALQVFCQVKVTSKAIVGPLLARRCDTVKGGSPGELTFQLLEAFLGADNVDI